jgi:hypothetical protein
MQSKKGSTTDAPWPNLPNRMFPMKKNLPGSPPPNGSSIPHLKISREARLITPEAGALPITGRR